jgi:hypothetical protein
MSTTLRGLRLVNLCAPSLSYDEQVQAASTAFDNQMHEIIDDTPVVSFIPSILQLADSQLIDILAWQFHVDFYDHSQPLDLRKQLVQNSIQWHTRKGTVALLQEVLDTFWFGGATIEEWYNYMSPLPPNYPTDDPLAFYTNFGSSSVNLPGDKFNINAHGLVDGDQIQFVVGASGVLPTPLAPGVYYYVLFLTTNSFQVSLSVGGAPVVITSTGTGTNDIWKGAGTWHDRYRFRALIDASIITPSDEGLALQLINAYKPVSRWFEGFFRATVGQCAIGWYSGMLRFVYRSSEPPDYAFGSTEALTL